MTMNRMKTPLIIIFYVLAGAQALAQEAVKISMNADTWNVESKDFKFEEYLGEKSIYLPDGFAYLNDVEFHNGIIEFDIAFPAGRGFPGIYFRIQDELNAEDFYVRPHQSGNPDANQYTPVFNGLAGWQLYHGDGYGAPVQYKYNDWNHVKLVVKGAVGEVYINDMSKPLYRIHELKHGDVKGPIALKGSAKAHFANVKIRLDESPELVLPAKELTELEPSVIKSYQVSNVLRDEVIMAKTELPESVIDNVSWETMQVDNSGTINIARVVKPEQGASTTLVKVAVMSDEEQVKRLEFGYSDIVQVFVNGITLYLGNNTFRTRDYRYLGTIGYFDAVFVPLQKGENEIVFSLTESFGGWGMKARFEDLKGITLK